MENTKLQPPKWLSKDALAIWREKIRRIASLKEAKELLNALDTELLAIYCNTLTLYQSARAKNHGKK